MDSVCFGEDYNSKFDPSWYLSAVYSPDCHILKEGSFLYKLHDELSKMGLYLKTFPELVNTNMMFNMIS